MLPERVDVRWGDFSQVECELALFKAVVKNGYDYYHLLSGVDLPIKSAQYLVDFFEKLIGSSDPVFRFLFCFFGGLFDGLFFLLESGFIQRGCNEFIDFGNFLFFFFFRFKDCMFEIVHCDPGQFRGRDFPFVAEGIAEHSDSQRGGAGDDILRGSGIEGQPSLVVEEDLRPCVGVVFVDIKGICESVVVTGRESGCDSCRESGEACHDSEGCCEIFAVSFFQFEKEEIGEFPVCRRFFRVEFIIVVIPEIIPQRDCLFIRCCLDIFFRGS